ncbi:MAG: hypothetical protein OXG92_10795 [Chloroflexi bacterium]|nr:hypothetical protein [Chloroflexota bacterium]MCY3581653.1 hypothetical protein [Chloroflexota bacterium]MCY3716939.1 hypothetical protein [Chloroflexota bacterium]MDE2650087.1 hypothetical protein [Chloroflexota bacterium]MXV93424.1 hypothetical protein [Chloroflexota bacterium]
MSAPATQQQIRSKLSPQRKSARKGHGATDNVADAHSENYRELAKQEVLDGIARGYVQALAGEHKPIEELFGKLE